MTNASTTNPVSAGKSILVICCNETCLDLQRVKILGRPHAATVHVPNRYTVECKGEWIDLLPMHMLDHNKRDSRYDEIYTCGHVYLNERGMHLLQARLIDLRSWPGYFSKFP